MFDVEGYGKIKAMFDAHLIDKRTFEIIKRADDVDAVRKIILITMTQQKIAAQQYEKDLPGLVRIIANADRVQKTAGVQAHTDIKKILKIWQDLLTESACPGEKEISVVLDEKTYYVITDYVNPSRAPSERDALAIRPEIKNIFIAEDKANEIPDHVMESLHEIAGAKIIMDSNEFIAEASGTMVFFGDANFEDEETVSLLCALLAKGIFVIVDESSKINLDHLIALKQAIEENPVESGKGVFCLNGEVYTKPFNLNVVIGDKKNLLKGGSTMDHGGTIEDVIEKIFPGGFIKLG